MMDSDFPNPRFEAQLEGEGYADALDLMNSVRRYVPTYPLYDTLTKRYVGVMPTARTGDPKAIWVVDNIDGKRKFLVEALVPPRWMPTDKIKLSGDSVIQVAGDNPTYQRARAYSEDSIDPVS